MALPRDSARAGFKIALSQGVAAIPHLVDTLQAVASELILTSDTPSSDFDIYVLMAAEPLPSLRCRPVIRIIVSTIEERTVRWGVRVGADAVMSPDVSVQDAHRVLEAATGGYFPVPSDLARALATRLEDPKPPMISERDRTILKLLAEGTTMSDIARELGCSERHARRQIRSLWNTMGVQNRAQGLVAAARRGFLDDDYRHNT